MSTPKSAVVKKGGPDLPKPLQAYLESTLGHIGEIAHDAEQLWDVGMRGLQLEIAGRILAGRAFQALSESLEPRTLSAELAARNIPRRSFYDAIDVYEMFAVLPQVEFVRACAQIEFSKIREMGRLPREEFLALASGKKIRGITLDAAAGMTVREFADAVRDPELVKASKKVAALQADKEGLAAELKELKGALKHRYENLKMPDFAAHARQESIALAEQMSLSVAAFEELIGERLSTDKEAKLYPEWVTRSAGTAYHSLRSVHARTQMLLERMEEQYGPEVTGKVDYEHTLSEGELLIARDSLAIILKRHKVEAENREADRANAKGGRGRPRSKKAVD